MNSLDQITSAFINRPDSFVQINSSLEQTVLFFTPGMFYIALLKNKTYVCECYDKGYRAGSMHFHGMIENNQFVEFDKDKKYINPYAYNTKHFSEIECDAWDVFVPIKIYTSIST